jgi:hypothetical protein
MADNVSGAKSGGDGPGEAGNFEGAFRRLVAKLMSVSPQQLDELLVAWRLKKGGG